MGNKEVAGGSKPWRRAAGLALVLLWCLTAGVVGAQWRNPAIGLAPGAVQSWPDATGRASLDQARAAFDAGRGRTADWSAIAPLGPGRAVWYRLALPHVAAPAQAVLTLPISSIDSVDLFRPNGSGWTVQRAGDSIPVGDWPVRYLHPAFALLLSPADPAPIAYLRVEHSHPVTVELLLRDGAGFDESNKLWHLLLGGYIGFLLLVVVLAVTHAVLWRDTIHLYYGVHVVLVGLVALSLTGLAGEYLWPWNAWWNDIAPAVLSSTALAGIALFLRRLVAERGRHGLSRVLLLLAATSFAIAIAYMEFGRPPVFLVHNVNAAVSLAVFLLAVGWYALRHPQVGGWVFAGMAVLALGALFPLLRNLGLDPPVFLTQYGLQLGAALEIPLVLIGLYFHSRERRDNQLRVNALARTDPLTGVASHRVLMERLDELLQRHRRDPLAGVVLRVRVANLATIANDYGREAAEAAVVRAAECVAQRAREGDTVAREQGGDLVLVLDGRLTRGEALATGRDIIAAGLKFSGRLPPAVTLSLLVAGACPPLPRGTGPALLALLGEIVEELGTHPSGRAMRVVHGPGATEGNSAPLAG